MNLRDNSERARYILLLFYVMLAITPVSLVSNIMEFNLLSSVYITDEAADQNDLRQGVIGIIQFLLQIAAWVFFIMWFRRAYFNLHAAGRHMEFQEGWAAGSWFVPFLNLVRPYQIMREIWVDTQFEIWGKKERSTALVGWWWTAFLLMGFVTNIASRLSLNVATLADLKVVTQLYILSDVLTLGALILVIFLIRETHKMEQQLFRNNREIAIEEHLI